MTEFSNDVRSIEGRRKQSNARMLAAGLGAIVSMVFCLTSSHVIGNDSPKNAGTFTMPIEDLVRHGVHGAFNIDGPCPKGDRNPTKSEQEVLDYAGGMSAGEGKGGDGSLLAISPKQVFEVGGRPVAYCGPDFGDNGARFGGNAVVFLGGTTIVDGPN